VCLSPSVRAPLMSSTSFPFLSDRKASAAIWRLAYLR
jgi:hypothetical protein